MDNDHAAWVPLAEPPEVKKGRVRVKDYATTMWVVPTPEGGAMWALKVLDDPEVAFVPDAVVKYLVRKTLPNSANKLYAALDRVNSDD
jgi:hypothetical protein